MADIDAELLALAGDDSSDEDEVPMNANGESSSSPDGKSNNKPKASTGKRVGGAKGRRGNDDESEEEGEA
jgi:RNA polymerase-associated protein RTF1